MAASVGLLTRQDEGLDTFGSCLTAVALLTVVDGEESCNIRDAVSNVNATTASHRSFMEE